MKWTPDSLLDLMRGFQAPAVLGAAAELDLFAALPGTPETVARKLRCDERALIILLDALAALGLVTKRGQSYRVPKDTAANLRLVLPMIHHQANCFRRWAQLAETVRTGKPAVRTPSVQGAAADYAAFIGAMHVINARSADKVIRSIRPLKFRHLLDVGGASGTWTIAFLRACRGATATLFDLPHVLPLAKTRLTAAGMIKRVKLVGGDYDRDGLPGGADLAWVSAIVHQNSRVENRAMFAKIRQALAPGGRIAIRDILMDENRTTPVMGALFAVNMLVGTEGGGTFTFRELRGDLTAAGFGDVQLACADTGMNTVVVATAG